MNFIFDSKCQNSGRTVNKGASWGVPVLGNNSGQVKEIMVDKSVDERPIKALSMEEILSTTVNIYFNILHSKVVKYQILILKVVNCNAWQSKKIYFPK